jgi:hypothetical protein
MIFINYKKKNPYKETIEKFSDENRLVSFGVVKSFISGKYKWLASYLFKGRNNTQTNKHRAFIGWFSDVELTLNEYGNIQELVSQPYFERRPRPKLPEFFVELASKQYRALGQEYTEYDTIQHVDLSGRIEIPFIDIGKENHKDVFHTFGDIPAFVCSGYIIPDYYTGQQIYVRQNPQVQVNLKFNNAEIILNDRRSDILNYEAVRLYLDGQESVVSAPADITGNGNLVASSPVLENRSTDINLMGFGLGEAALMIDGLIGYQYPEGVGYPAMLSILWNSGTNDFTLSREPSLYSDYVDLYFGGDWSNGYDIMMKVDNTEVRIPDIGLFPPLDPLPIRFKPRYQFLP